MKQCAGITSSGTRCERIVPDSAELCYSHDSGRAAERSRNASKAARSKVPGEIRQVKRQLRSIANDVLSKKISRGDASVAAQILGVYLRAHEVEHKLVSSEQLEARILALEELLERQGDRHGLG